MRRKTKISRLASLVFVLVLVPYLTMSFAAGRSLSYLLHSHDDIEHHAHQIQENLSLITSAWHQNRLHSIEGIQVRNQSAEPIALDKIPLEKSSILELKIDAIGHLRSVLLDADLFNSLPIDRPRMTLAFIMVQDLSLYIKGSLALSGSLPMGRSHVASLLLCSHAILI
jgi:hypothetical protein